MSDQHEASAGERGGAHQRNVNPKESDQLQSASSSVHSANAWEKAQFDDDSRKQKFLRLMGAGKKEHHGRFVIGDTKTEHGRAEENVQQMNTDLERQYVGGIQKKVTGGRKMGLGFTEAEPEPEPQPTEQHAADGQEGANVEQSERDMQMRQSHQDSAREERQYSDRDEARDYRDRRDNYRDRDEHRRDRQNYHDQGTRDRRDYRDRRDDSRSQDRGYQRHSYDRGNQHYRDNRHSERQDYGGYQQQGGYGGHRPGFGQNPSQAHSAASNQGWSQNSGANPPVSQSAANATAIDLSVPPPSSQPPSQPTDSKGKYQMSFVKSND